MKTVRFHPEAEAEMAAAARRYESQQKHLGRRFLAAIQDAVNRLRINPGLYGAVEADVRRCPVRTFPYAVLFRDQQERIAIVAVMHLRRDPKYWTNRIRSE